MKYIDAEKLIAEIRIIQQSLEHSDVRSNQVKKIRTECMIEFCKCLYGVIDSLRQEQPSEDLEEEIIDWAGKFNPAIREEIQSTAYHFAGWQKEQDERLIKLTHDSWYKEGFIYGQIEGLSEEEKYQQGQFDIKEQMIKEAVDGEVCSDLANINFVRTTSKIPSDLYFGDRVKIIIVKMD